MYSSLSSIETARFLEGTAVLPKQNEQGATIDMPTTREFSIRMEDKPGALGRMCRTLAEQGVNIVGFQSVPAEGKSVVRLVTDNPTETKTAIEKLKLTFAETQVVQVKLPHRPGELARAASKLGEANININYAYCGLDPVTNGPLLFFGVEDTRQATDVLSQVAASAKA